MLRERTVQRVADRPYTLLSCGMSIDGYLDSAGAARLRLSNAADFDRIDAERARCDAILVGTATVRSDNPQLLVRAHIAPTRGSFEPVVAHRHSTAYSLVEGPIRRWRCRSEQCLLGAFDPRVVGSIPTGPTVLMCCFG